MTTIILDIETIPSPEALTRAPDEAYLMSGVAVTWGDDAVAKHRAKREAQWAKDAPKVAALDWRLGQICAVGIWQGGHGSLCNTEARSEADLLGDTWARLGTSGTRLAGFCLRSFDLPYLLGRSAVLGVKVPRRFNAGRYTHTEVLDWADVLSNYGGFSTAGWTLERYASVFQLPGGYGNGADVYGWYQAGKWDEIAKHCHADLTMTAGLHQKCAGAFGV